MRMKLSIQLRITQCHLTGAPCCLKEIRPWLNWLELKEANPTEGRNSLFLRSQVWNKIGYLDPKIVFQDSNQRSPGPQMKKPFKTASVWFKNMRNPFFGMNIKLWLPVTRMVRVWAQNIGQCFYGEVIQNTSQHLADKWLCTEAIHIWKFGGFFF